MAETDRIEPAQAQRGRFGGLLLVAGGGLATAFCAASCCGLPVLLARWALAADGSSRSRGLWPRIGRRCCLRPSC
jgi:hypothetical protein